MIRAMTMCSSTEEEAMKAILIDPHKREVRVVDDDFYDYRVIQQYLAQGERGPLSALLSSGPNISLDIHSYVDDEGCFREGQAWFRLSGYANAIAGYMLVLQSGSAGGEQGLGDPDFWRDVLTHISTWETPEAARADFPPITGSTLDPDGKETLVSSHPVDFNQRWPYAKTEEE
jgi:hypothetical protein